MKQDLIKRQVYIGMNGYAIQTNIETYRNYYKLLGWEYLGQATPLSIIEAIECYDREALNTRQGKLL